MVRMTYILGREKRGEILVKNSEKGFDFEPKTLHNRFVRFLGLPK